MLSKRSSLVRKIYTRKHFLRVKNPIYAKEILAHTLNEWQRDFQKNEDITTQILKLAEKKTKGFLIAKQSGILAGREEIEFFFQYLLRKKRIQNFRYRFFKKDGDRLQKNDQIGFFQGKAKDILSLERTVLNFLQRMSGVASYVNLFVQKIPESVVLAPTRKTLWGLLDKKACVLGGAGTHRLSLRDAILVKDTHLDLIEHRLENIFQLLTSKNAWKSAPAFFEIEVENIQEAQKIVELFEKLKVNQSPAPFFLMLDNMNPREISTFLKWFKIRPSFKKIFVEISGGINLKNISRYAKTGVDVISIGALTHSAPALDISLRICLKSPFR